MRRSHLQTAADAFARAIFCLTNHGVASAAGGGACGRIDRCSFTLENKYISATPPAQMRKNKNASALMRALRAR